MYDLTKATDGNIFTLIGYTKKAMFKERFTSSEVSQMIAEATSCKSYEECIVLLDTYIEKCNERSEN